MEFNVTTITSWDQNHLPWADEEFRTIFSYKITELESNGVMLEEIPEPKLEQISDASGILGMVIERKFIDENSANEWINFQLEITKKYNKKLISARLK